MKKRITWNSAQTWVTKIVKNHGPVHRQPLSSHKTWEWMIRHRPVYWDDCGVVWTLRTTWCDAAGGLRIMRNPAENLR